MYSIKSLHYFIRKVNNYFSELKNLSPQQYKQELSYIKEAIAIFLSNFPQTLKDIFLDSLNADLLKEISALKPSRVTKDVEKDMDDFVDNIHLKYKGYLKLFIGRDAYYFYLRYQKKYTTPDNNDAVSVLYTRKLLLGSYNGPKYLSLTDLIYKSMPNSNDITLFKKNYKKNLQTIKNIHINRKTETILSKYMIKEHLDKIVIIDSGVQGSVILPLIIYFENKKKVVDFYM
jgi:hypothetical protein